MSFWLAVAAVWSGAFVVVAAICALDARRERRSTEGPRPNLRLVPPPAGARDPIGRPGHETLLGGVRALAELVDATHVALTRGRSGDSPVADTGDPVADADAPTVVAPLFREGERVGTLTARRRPGAEPFSPRQFETIYACAVVLGAMVDAERADDSGGGGGLRRHARLRSV